MKATFALLADHPTHNFVRKLAWQLHQMYGTGLRASWLPPHISLKQPFAIDDLAALEAYFDQFATALSSFSATLPNVHVISAPAASHITGIVWLNVEETPLLRNLHMRLNADLAAQFGNTAAPFDGADYHFHMTLAISNHPTQAYTEIQATYENMDVNVQYTVRELAMFVYDALSSEIEYMTYKIIQFKE
ncbi:MAG: 2'-5' RNA ligase family protein [Chloroflexota bacterium]|nr:2'-5' RNA ligase family protein [Chloroflexota bacterium]